MRIAHKGLGGAKYSTLGARCGYSPMRFNPLTQIMQSKSITALKPFNDEHFLDFYFHRMHDTLSNKNLAGARVIFGFQRFTTIPAA